MGWLRSILDWIGRFQVVQSLFALIKPLILPWLIAMLTGVAGYYGGQPWMWILMAAALAFMGTVVGIFFGGLYRDRNTPVHKVLYVGTQVNYDLIPLTRHGRRVQSTGAVAARALEKTQIGVALHNSARFPISVLLQSAETEMGGKTPPRSMFPRRSTIILPGNTVFLM